MKAPCGVRSKSWAWHIGLAVALWPLLGASQAGSTSVGTSVGTSVNTSVNTSDWPATAAEQRLPADALPGAPGWACSQSLALPAAGQQLALCRRTAAPGSTELSLLWLNPAAAVNQRLRQIARLADANAAQLRLFTAPSGCAAGRCLAALVLVDQRDESSCYGTQVLAVAATGAVHSLGFINEVLVDSSSTTCVGSLAQVSGSAAGVQIKLPAGLSRVGRDGVALALGPLQVSYRIAAAKLALQRKASLP